MSPTGSGTIRIAVTQWNIPACADAATNYIRYKRGSGLGSKGSGLGSKGL